MGIKAKRLVSFRVATIKLRHCLVVASGEGGYLPALGSRQVGEGKRDQQQVAAFRHCPRLCPRGCPRLASVNPPALS